MRSIAGRSVFCPPSAFGVSAFRLFGRVPASFLQKFVKTKIYKISLAMCGGA